MFHGNTAINKTGRTNLALLMPTHWWDGSIHSYEDGEGWCYVGVNGTGDIRFLGDNPPNTADTAGNTEGTKLYWYDGTNYWRVIGAIGVNTSNQVAHKFYQQGDWVMYDVEQNIIDVTDSATTWTDLDCSGVFPAISEMIKLWCLLDGMNNWSLRTDGSSGTGYLTNAEYHTPVIVDMVSSGQIVEYKSGDPSLDVDVSVIGYYIGHMR